jgi:hypothetical protein
VNDELERMSKEAVSPDLSTIPALIVGLKKTTKNISQDSWSQGRYFKVEPSEYESRDHDVWR